MPCTTTPNVMKVGSMFWRTHCIQPPLIFCLALYCVYSFFCCAACPFSRQKSQAWVTTPISTQLLLLPAWYQPQTAQYLHSCQAGLLYKTLQRAVAGRVACCAASVHDALRRSRQSVMMARHTHHTAAPGGCGPSRRMEAIHHHQTNPSVNPGVTRSPLLSCSDTTLFA